MSEPGLPTRVPEIFGPQEGQIMKTAITNVQIFDGVSIINERSVVVDHGLIRQVGGPIPADAESTEQADVFCPD